jgi:hypothetical protein
MVKQAGFVALLVLLLALAGAQDRAKGASKEECPTFDLAEQEQLLTKVPSCNRAIKLFEICQRGSSGDLSLGEIVTKKCERDFLSKLSKSERGRYDGKLKACARKYAKESGTMYRSFEAFCGADVARKYSDAALKGGRPK